MKKLSEQNVYVKKGSMITEKTVVAGKIPVIAGGRKPAYYHNRANRNGVSITISASGASAGYVSLHKTPIFASDCSTISEDDGYNIKYVFYVLQHNQKNIYKLQTGGAQPHIHPKDIEGIEHDLPPLEEQEKVAAILSDLDDLLEKQEALIEKKKAIKEATMELLLTGKQRLPGFSGDWEEKRLGEVAEFYKGKGLSKADLVTDGELFCVHYGELFTKYKTKIKIIDSRTNTKISMPFLSLKNDVLMPTSDVTPTGLAKASCINQSGVVLGGDILVIRAKDSEIDGVFISYIIRKDKAQIQSLVTGSTVYHLYASGMAKFKTKIPPLSEQKKIVEILVTIDDEIDVLNSIFEKMKQQKEAVMHKLLTGEIRVA